MLPGISGSSLISPGEDDIRYEIISHLPKSTKNSLLDCLHGLWLPWTSSDLWRTSAVIPSHKPGTHPQLPQSYKLIALTKSVCKLFERMLNKRLVWYLESFVAVWF